jgi:hypothetical protein
MRLILIATLAAFATAAAAEEPTTLQAVTTKGIVMKAFGMQIPVSYTPDGKFTARPPGGGEVAGSWKIKGETLCTTTTTDPTETCAAYPAGKKSGETFDVPGAMGAAMGVVAVKIN